MILSKVGSRVLVLAVVGSVILVGRCLAQSPVAETHDCRDVRL